MNYPFPAEVPPFLRGIIPPPSSPEFLMKCLTALSAARSEMDKLVMVDGVLGSNSTGISAWLENNMLRSIDEVASRRHEFSTIAQQGEQSQGVIAGVFVSILKSLAGEGEKLRSQIGRELEQVQASRNGQIGYTYGRILGHCIMR